MTIHINPFWAGFIVGGLSAFITWFGVVIYFGIKSDKNDKNKES